MGVSPKTLRYYRDRLSKFAISVNYLRAKRQDIERYLNTIRPNQYGLATRHASYRAIKAFYRWLNTEYDITNPVVRIPPPIVSKVILPSLEREQVQLLIKKLSTVRDKAIISLFTESGLRLSELVNIKANDIDWQNPLGEKSIG